MQPSKEDLTCVGNGPAVQKCMPCNRGYDREQVIRPVLKFQRKPIELLLAANAFGSLSECLIVQVLEFACRKARNERETLTARYDSLAEATHIPIKPVGKEGRQAKCEEEQDRGA